MELKLLAAHDTGRSTDWVFTVLPYSGEVVTWEQESVKRMICVYNLVDGQLQRLREVQAAHVSCLLGVIIEGREFLFVASFADDVKLVDMANGEVSAVYHCEPHPRRMCLGEPGKLWVLFSARSSGNTYDVIELSYSSSVLAPSGRTVKTPIPFPSGLCYIPAPIDALVIARPSSFLCQCISLESCDELWKVKGIVDGKRVWPFGVAYFPQHQVLLIADKENKRILALDPGSGSHLQSLPVPEEVGKPQELCLQNDKLFCASFDGSDSAHGKISCFSLR